MAASRKWLKQSAAWRAAGKCGQCGADPEPGKKKCAKHLAVDRNSMRRGRDRKRAAGLCIRCGEPGRGGWCDGCRAKQATYFRDWKARRKAVAAE